MTDQRTTGDRIRKFFNNDNTVGYVFAMPFILGFLGFSLVPMITSFVYSFTDMTFGAKEINFIGFENFKELLHDDIFFKSLRVTFKYVIISVPLKLTFALLVAFLLTRKSRMVTLYRSLYYIPSLVGGSVAVALVWKQIFARKGLFNVVWKQIFGAEAAVNWFGDERLAMYPLILMSVWQFGSSMIIFAAGLRRYPKVTTKRP